MAEKTAVLSPVDQLMPRTYTRVFLVWPVADEDAADAVTRLSLGLAALFRRLPYLGGRVSQRPDRGNRLAVSWFTEAAEPELAEVAAPADMPAYDDLARTNAPLHRFTRTLCLVHVIPPDVDAPVFAASYTRLDGGLLLCYAVHHAAMDGAGVAELAGLWAACCRGGDAGAVPPLPDANEPTHRSARLQSAAGEGTPVTATLAELLHRCPQYRLLSAGAPQVLPSPLPASTSRLFRFSASKLVRTRDMLGETAGGERQLTTNNILTAIIWACVTRVRLARSPPSDGTSRLGFAVDGRRRLGDDFGAGRYLGNVNMYGLAEVPLATLQSASRYAFMPSSGPPRSGQCRSDFAAVVDAFAAAVARITRPVIAEVLSLVDQAPDVTDLGPGWRPFHGLDLSLTSWANQAYYVCEFGAPLGRPAFVRVPFAEYDGLAIVLPRRRDGDDGKLDVVLFLNADDIIALESDGSWNSWA